MKYFFFQVSLCVVMLLFIPFGTETASSSDNSDRFSGREKLDISDLMFISADALIVDYLAEGINCRTTAVFAQLDTPIQNYVIDSLLEEIGPEGIFQLKEIGGGCMEWEEEIQQSNNSSVLKKDLEQHSAAATYKVEFIEEAGGSGGAAPSYIVRDSSSYGWMCNSGNPESPADYIVQTYVYGSYVNSAALRVRGTHAGASCMIQSQNAARVYDSNWIFMCVGYWSAFFCLEQVEASDIRTWRSY